VRIACLVLASINNYDGEIVYVNCVILFVF
jgi:hypothetical protein